MYDMRERQIEHKREIQGNKKAARGFQSIYNIDHTISCYVFFYNLT